LLGYDQDEGFVLVRDLDNPSARRLPNTDLAAQLSLSPDGSWIAFNRSDALRKMPIDGGPAITICASPTIRGTAWGADGTIVFAANNRGPLCRVDFNGGKPEPFYQSPDDDTFSDRYPAMLPHRRGVLFNRTSGDGAEWDHTSVWVVDLDGGRPKELVRNAAHGRYLDAGYLVFQREDTLMAAGFDLRRLELTTAEAPVLRDLAAGTPSGPAQFDLSANGTFVYMVGDVAPRDLHIDFVSLDGTITPLTPRTGQFGKAVPSDDGRFLAIEVEDPLGPDHLAVLELGRDLLRAVPHEGRGGDSFPVWSPDGRWLAFSSNRHGGSYSVYRYAVGDESVPKLLLELNRYCLPNDWSNDGRSLLVRYEVEGAGVDLGLIHFDEQGEPSDAKIIGPEYSFGPGSPPTTAGCSSRRPRRRRATARSLLSRRRIRQGRFKSRPPEVI
jgi:dipeptidyl aminopeptidase/acylaminoacyl peptidase